MNIRSFVCKRTGMIIFLIVSFLTTPAWSDEARLTDIVVTNTRDDILIYFTVRDCFTEEMNRAIENGINTTFTFFVRLYEIRDFSLDKMIADLKVSHDVQYDNLKKIYKVRLSERNDKPIFVQDFNEAKELMSEIVELRVAELSNLRRGARYKVCMMAELDTVRLPFYLHYVFFFLSLWDFETDWYTVEFRY